MAQSAFGLTGKIESLDFAKNIVRLAAFSAILLAIARIAHEAYLEVIIIIPLVIVLLIWQSRFIAVFLFFFVGLLSLFTLSDTIPMLLEGRYMPLYLPLFYLCVLWLSYRAIRATIFIHNDSEKLSLESIQDVFE